MKKLVLVMMDQEGGPRMNAYSANQRRGQKRWSAIQGNVPGSSVGTDRHCRNIG